MEQIRNDEYMEFKHELLRRKTYPFIFHNRILARAFYERFKEEVPTARYYEQDEIGQVITHDQRAEKRLWQLFKDHQTAHEKAILDLCEVRFDIEASIQSKETMLTKKKR